jgi:hypothetical protein
MFTCVIGVKKLNFLPMGLTWVLACGNAGNVGFGIQCGKLSKIKFDSYQFRFKNLADSSTRCNTYWLASIILTEPTGIHDARTNYTHDRCTTGSVGIGTTGRSE